MKKAIAFIPARGGSKGIPKKNLVDLGGKPLIAHTIEVGCKSPFIERVVVSSDSVEILEASKKFGAEVLLRPTDLSSDQSPTTDAIKHFITSNQFEKEGIDTIVLMQATSPFRTVAQLNEAMELYKNSNIESLISVSEYDVSPYRSYIMEKDKNLKQIFGNDMLGKRRQDYEKTVAANGAIYIFHIAKFLELGAIPFQNVIGYEMQAPTDMDIDTPLDLDFCRFLLNNGTVKL